MKNEQMPEKRLFVLSNDTHYLNLRNYIQTHNIGENYIIYICKYPIGYKEFIKKLKQDQSIQQVKVIYHNQKSKFPFNNFYLLTLLLKIKQLKNFGPSYDIIFFSNYLSWIQQFVVSQFITQETTKFGLINDGIAIFKTINLRKITTSIDFPNLNRFLSKFLGSFTIDNLHFYSPIEVEVAEQDTLELFYFNTSNTSIIDSKKIYFIGSDLVELGLLYLENHLIYLKQIKERFSEYQIFYFAHRGENDELVEKYKFLGNVVRDSLPFEERMEKEKELPGAIISYSSSVLINLPQVYPQLLFFYYPLEMESIPAGSRFKKTYPELLKYFEKIKTPNFAELDFGQKTSF